LKKNAETEELPFDNQTLVFRVMGKMFAVTNIDNFESINLKCNPEVAIELRDKYDAVIPGYHMNKKHWNTVKINADVKDDLIFEWIDSSYQLVISGLPKKIKQQFL